MAGLRCVLRTAELQKPPTHTHCFHGNRRRRHSAPAALHISQCPASRNHSRCCPSRCSHTSHRRRSFVVRLSLVSPSRGGAAGCPRGDAAASRGGVAGCRPAGAAGCARGAAAGWASHGGGSGRHRGAGRRRDGRSRRGRSGHSHLCRLLRHSHHLRIRHPAGRHSHRPAERRSRRRSRRQGGRRSRRRSRRRGGRSHRPEDRRAGPAKQESRAASAAATQRHDASRRASRRRSSAGGSHPRGELGARPLGERDADGAPAQVLVVQRRDGLLQRAGQRPESAPGAACCG